MPQPAKRLSGWLVRFSQPSRRQLKRLMARPRLKKARRQFKKMVNIASFGRAYALGALAILLVSSLFWTVLGAQQQAVNADQLVDPFLFSDKITFHGANFPAAHSFLLKWPVFYAIRLANFAPWAYVVATIGLVLITVAGLAWLLYRIDRRPVVFGTLCLALASVLLLVPAQPYAGGILPVNFAMIATRNIEYVLYLACLVKLSRLPAIRSWQFAGSVLGLSVLLASDKLFLTITLASALLFLVLYAFAQNWKLVNLAVSWLLAGSVAVVLSTMLLIVIDKTQLTNILSESASTGPYSLVGSYKAGALGIFYGFMGLLTNFGANPAFDATRLADVPGRLASGLFSFGGFGYTVNTGILLAVVAASYRTIRASFTKRRYKQFERNPASRLSLMLLASSAVSVGTYILADHYYAVDSRYLALSLFSGFVTLAAYSQTRKRLSSSWLVAAGTAMVLAMLLAVPHVLAVRHDQVAALQSITERTKVINQALRQHKVARLVGDYWRVVPIKAVVPQTAILPLASCTQPRASLSSQDWQRSLQKQSFAYLLTLDRSLTDYPNCTLRQVAASYGQPNSSLLIAGSYDEPKELLLFYDNGLRTKPSPADTSLPVAATIEPIAIEDLPAATCFRPTIMNVVAHQDDDLLFLNPDLQHSLDQGNCIRTIYLTAGDSGYNRFYWTKRQQGAEAAYAKMLGLPNQWVQWVVKMGANQYVTVASPINSKKVSLVFINLPDGNLHGDGFAGSQNESLAKLEAGEITDIQSVDGQTNFTASQLTTVLSTLMQLYQPAEIRTQADAPSDNYPDHSDHISTKHFTERARQQYQTIQFNDSVTIPLKFYIGYPIRGQEPNLSNEDFSRKEAAFLTYAQFDGGVCSTENMCRQTPTYGAYLSRQYQQP